MCRGAIVLRDMAMSCSKGDWPPQAAGKENTALALSMNQLSQSDHKASGEQPKKLRLQCCTSCIDLHFRSLIKRKAGSSRIHTNYD
ncbi:hypothetical protein llap_15000 [Limosa lapponica baueri]|uniref:Uncharacterized protein n=1 Tax=Limosa lapponica baueri TaxID=1758121 RepID=A0A2I0TLK1_LIMLA|nr:hypothetical protein llap_15000 [Limosa lapponica baueri]